MRHLPQWTARGLAPKPLQSKCHFSLWSLLMAMHVDDVDATTGGGQFRTSLFLFGNVSFVFGHKTPRYGVSKQIDP